MDKKNTMLLTVIAVATLLVAVVGATFAYFSIVQSGSGSTETDFNGQIQKWDDTATITLDEVDGDGQPTDADNLYLAVTAADMGYANIGHKYWAKRETDASTEKGQNTEKVTVSASDMETGDAKHLYTISTAHIKGGTKDKAYTCTSKLTVKLVNHSAFDTAMQTNNNGADGRYDDGIFYFAQGTSDPGETNTITFAKPELGAATDGQFTFKELHAAGDNGLTATVTYKLKAQGPDADSKAPVEVGFMLENTEGSQNDLADKSIEIKINNSGFQCSEDATE